MQALRRSLALLLFLAVSPLAVPHASALTTQWGDFIDGNAPGVLIVTFPDGSTRRSDAATYAGCVDPTLDECVPRLRLPPFHTADGDWKAALILDYPYPTGSAYFRISFSIAGWQETNMAFSTCSGPTYAVSWLLDRDTSTWTFYCNTVLV